MQKQALNLVILCLVIFLSFPALAENDTIPVKREVSNGSQMELVQNDIKVEEYDITPLNTKGIKETVVPDPQKEGKKVIGLFLKTMATVAFSAIVIYLILLFIRKFYSSAFMEGENQELENFDLSVPTTKIDALRSFLNRTK